ncbi:uncharacterized protein [Pyxicephalus adspersus]|uniref:uncharacterized protein isoform X1 n=1 Tax=Pyxicephalus adspersus TaxID=30357 RepID=UPI003B5B8765
MSRQIPLSILLLTVLALAVGQNDCGNCLHLDSGAVIGIVTCDVVITVLIAGMAFWISSKVQKKKYDDKLQQKNSADNDHTYENIHLPYPDEADFAL